MVLNASPSYLFCFLWNLIISRQYCVLFVIGLEPEVTSYLWSSRWLSVTVDGSSNLLSVARC